MNVLIVLIIVEFARTQRVALSVFKDISNLTISANQIVGLDISQIIQHKLAINVVINVIFASTQTYVIIVQQKLFYKVISV